MQKTILMYLATMLAVCASVAYNITGTTYPGEAVEETVVTMQGQTIAVFPGSGDVEFKIAAIPQLQMRIGGYSQVSTTNHDEHIGYGGKLLNVDNIVTATLPTIWLVDDAGYAYLNPEYIVSSDILLETYHARLAYDVSTNAMSLAAGGQLVPVQGNVSGDVEVRGTVAYAGYDSITNIAYEIANSADIVATATNTLHQHLLDSWYAFTDTIPNGSTSNRFDYPDYYDSSTIWGSVKPTHYVENPNFMFADIDFSGVSTWQSTYKGRARVVTAISPSWVLMVNHIYYGFNYVVPIGARIAFLGTDGVEVVRTVTEQYFAKNWRDCHLLKLDSPLPATVTPVKLLNWDDHARIPDITGIPAVNLDQRRVARTVFGFGIYSTRYLSHPYNIASSALGSASGLLTRDAINVPEIYNITDTRLTNNIFAVGGNWAVDGDSGSPVFWIDGTVPILTTMLTSSSGYGTPLDRQLQNWITDIVEASGDSLTLTDYSDYPYLSNYKARTTMTTTYELVDDVPTTMLLFPEIYSHIYYGNAYDSTVVIGDDYLDDVFIAYAGDHEETNSLWYCEYTDLETDAEVGVGRQWGSYFFTNMVFDGPLIFSVTIPPMPESMYGSVTEIFMRQTYDMGGYSVPHAITMNIVGRDTDYTYKTAGSMSYMYITNSATSPTTFDFYGDAVNTNPIPWYDIGLFKATLYEVTKENVDNNVPLHVNGGYY